MDSQPFATKYPKLSIPESEVSRMLGMSVQRLRAQRIRRVLQKHFSEVEYSIEALDQWHEQSQGPQFGSVA